jgi:prolyl oligopeptidase
MKPTHAQFAALTASALMAASAAAQPTAVAEPTDPYLWLEEVQGERALNWVKDRNAASLAVLRARPEYASIRDKTLAMLQSTDKIAYVFRVGPHLYNLWTNETNKRGLLRRTSLDEYRKAAPKWDTVLDIDALGKAEKENWVYKGINCLQPAYQRCLVSLSRGGADAVVVREFDAQTLKFIDGGFMLTEAKQSVDWVDENTLAVNSDFGPGTLTKSGYARIGKLWKRGTALKEAQTLFEGTEADVSAGISVDDSVKPGRLLAYRSIDFWNTESHLRVGNEWKKLDVPSHAVVRPTRGWLFIQPRQDWTVKLGDTETQHPAGTLLAIREDGFWRGERNFQVLYAPSATTSMAGYAVTNQHVIVNVLDNVAGRLVEWRMPQGASEWQSRKLPPVREQSLGTWSIGSWADPNVPNDPWANTYSINYADFLTPDSYILATAGTDNREELRRLPARFDASGMRAEQRFAVSKDGTRVPYFLVLPKNAKAGEALPTLLYGYGGFRIPQAPFYSGSWGMNWLERGGAVVVAGIRGGGEYGPRWHQAALKANRQKSFDDFIAIGEHLIASGVTKPQHLGIYGGSNGGLLTGAVAMQRPELFGAVISAVPLLDMKRYHKLLAGNSWMAEYGDPDKADEWAYISKYSPYHNIKAKADGGKYPRMLFTTSTRDDRVHPAHARKMVARLQELGHEVLYYENIEGGHGGAADLAQRADLTGIQFAYLWAQLSAR